MGLRLKFNLTLFLATVLGLAVTGLLGHRMLQEDARDEVLRTARLMMESALAVRGYTVKEVRPLLAELQVNSDKFLAQTVPAYAAHRYISRVQERYPDFSYKEATLNPTNPANRASEWEADLVSFFRNSAESRNELIGERETSTGRMLYLAHPIRIANPSCLTCHGRPADAPRALRASYGDNNGFGWKLEEVVGAQLVTVPMALPFRQAREAFITFMAGQVAVFLALAILLNIMLHYIIIKRVRAVSAKADEVSLGSLNVEELHVGGKDEIASMGRSFNRMHRSLTNAMRMLDESAGKR
ncbi:MAG: DUF3365 domain-containing protein [Gammaproteobacteria bacterium]|jgi:protein-histidine pros-kinase|nr:DUF3365 domain-containing protein [Gammaproteobacteria bacterium]